MKTGAVYLISLADAPVGDGKASPCDVWAEPWGKQYFEAKLATAKPWTATADTQGSGIKAVVLRADEVEDKPMEYLGDELVPIPLEMLSGLCAHPGEGKTQMCLALAADGSRGIDTFSQSKIKPFKTLYWTNESLPRTLRRRYVAQGGDVKSLFILTGAVDANGKPAHLTLENISELEQAVKQAQAKLLVIDPVQSFIGARIDMHRANEMRPLLDGLSAMAERLKLAVIVVRHLSKMGGSHAVTRALGSVDITAKIRTEYMIGHAPDNARNKALVHSKPGECRRAESLSFDIVEGRNKAPKLVWKGISQLTLSDITAPEGVRHKSKVELASEYLFDALKDGPKPMKSLVTEEYDARTLQRAALKIGVVKSGRGGKDGEWIWALPELKFARKYGVGRGTGNEYSCRLVVLSPCRLVALPIHDNPTRRQPDKYMYVVAFPRPRSRGSLVADAVRSHQQQGGNEMNKYKGLTLEEHRAIGELCKTMDEELWRIVGRYNKTSRQSRAAHRLQKALANFRSAMDNEICRLPDREFHRVDHPLQIYYGASLRSSGNDTRRAHEYTTNDQR